MKNEVIQKLQDWKLEANNPRNDGWVRKGYQDKIDEVVSYLTETQSEDKVSNKEAFEIVLKLAKANTLAEHDIMYAQQEAQASLERQAIEIVEDYCNDLIRR